MLKKTSVLSSAIAFLIAGSAPSHAQFGAQNALVVSSCGSQSLSAGGNQPVTIDTTGKLCSSATPSGTSSVNVQPSASSSVANAAVSTSALAANLVVKASAGNLYGFEVAADSTLSGAAWWVMVYNATSAPADGAVTPIKCYALTSGSVSFTAQFTTPISFSTGIVIGVSTTGCFSKTASAHAFISGDAQ